MIYLDVSRLLSRVEAATPTGIDRVELEYAKHFLAAGGRFVAQTSNHVVEIPVWLTREVADTLDTRWREGSAPEPRLGALVDRWRQLNRVTRDVGNVERFFADLVRSRGAERWRLIRKTEHAIRQRAGPIPFPVAAAALHVMPQLLQRAVAPRPEPVTHGPALLVNALSKRKIYLSVGHAGLERPGLLQRLGQTPGLVRVVYVHDALPVSHPELFKKGVEVAHRLRMENVETEADVVFTNSHFTTSELTRHFPSTRVQGVLEIGVTPPAETPEPVVAAARRGFVTIGTIEPRKNHLWLVEAWLDFCRRNPALVGDEVLTLFGKKGWLADSDRDRLMAMIEESPHVTLIEGADDRAIADALRSARGYVTAAHVEGWGMPLAESLTLGTPVLASDIAAHREVTQGCATFFALGDAKALTAAFHQFYDAAGAAQAHNTAEAFSPWTWESHFERLSEALTILEAPAAS